MLRIPKAANSELNMTPMIDIVFQLILFFLFSLKFKSLDWRIDSDLPRNAGQDIGSPVEPSPSVKASLVRLDGEDPALARTRLKVAGREWILPELSRDGVRARDAFVEQLTRQLAELREAVPELHGQIDTPRPNGVHVPHGDVIAVLDAFVKAKYSNVDFVGTPAPLPRAR
jgi:biopolymer transport protein ExbD